MLMLRTDKVVLAPLTEGDLPDLFRWINERNDVRHNAPYKPVSYSAHRRWFEAIQQRRDVVLLGIRLAKTDVLIGTCQLHSIHPVHRSAELQIRIGEACERGQGYGTEAMRLLLDHAFGDLNLQRVGLQVFATNEAAVGAYKKSGFVQEGILRKAAYIDGRYVDVIVMSVLREDHVAS
jgi:RimJ/RimL family protein N-acetyltransferase